MAVLALDIGGANIKAAHSDGGAWSVPFALWKEPENLAEKLREVARSGPSFDELRVTMTGELCDCFETKRHGVNHILDAVETLGGDSVRIWSTAEKYVDVAAARAEPLKVAASNWHALATWVARQFPEDQALLVDVGSTTTDIIPLSRGRVVAKGSTDMERLANAELDYLGVMRTPLMALAEAITWRERTFPLMAERFATLDDVHLLTGDVSEDPDDCDTADGRPRTRLFSAARIVRMIGADLEMLTVNDAVEIARLFARIQENRIIKAISRVATHDPCRVVVSGSGEFMACRGVHVWMDKAKTKIEIVRMSETIGSKASVAACAWALLRLQA